MFKYAFALVLGAAIGPLFIEHEEEHVYTCTTDTECMVECMQVTGKTQDECADY